MKNEMDQAGILNKFQAEADVKRIDSLLERRKIYNEQKNAVRAALAYSNFNNSNKIIFEDNQDIRNCNTNDGQQFSKKSGTRNNNTTKKSLFDDEDSDPDEDPNKIFEMRKKFQGKAGEKLLKLQSTFKNDKRFMLDEKFLEHEEHDEKPGENGEENLNLEDEKKKEFEILGEILGKEVKSLDKHDKRRIGIENEVKVMRRFDPSQPDHLKYERRKENPKPSGKKKQEAPGNDKKVEDKEEPKVSTEVFYEVKDDLKKSLEGDKQFSLLNMFGTVEEKGEVSSNDKAIPIRNKTNAFTSENPFKYDSSDDEDQIEQLSQNEKPVSKLPNSFRVWSEPLFFQEDDFRLQEGVDFVKRIATEEKQDFVQIRRNLKEIARNKVRNNLRKNRPFKKKLGGNRKKKVKRLVKALKR